MKLTPAWRNRLRNLTTIFLVLTVVAIIYTLVQWIRSEPGSFEPLNVLFFAVFSVASAISAWLSRPNNVQPPASSEIALAETPAFGPLRRQITNLFSLEELRVLCLDVGVRYDALSGDTIDTKAASLLAYAERRGQLNKLMAALQQERPHVKWPIPNTLQNFYNLRRNVQATWIDGVLKQSVTDEIALELNLTLEPHALTRKVAYVPGQAVKPVEKEVPQLFTDFGSLLILGEPGSGKTMTLLQLAESLLNAVQENATLLTPVVINLSSWANEKKPIVEWLVEELWQQYQLSREVGQAIIQNNQLIYLLDGLDEVAEVARDSCVQAINLFSEQHSGGLVVCCRAAEYEALQNRLNLGMGIHILPLDKAQVDAYFQRPELALESAYKLWQRDETLQKLTQTPLFLSVITLAYRGLNQENLNQLNTEAAWQDHLYCHYVAEMFKRHPILANSNYDQTQALNWLTNLAYGMRNHDQTIFFIEGLTPTWLPETSLRQRYIWINRCVSGMLFATVSFLVVKTFVGTLFGVIFGILSSILSIFLVSRKRNITPLESAIQKHLMNSLDSSPRKLLRNTRRLFFRISFLLLIIFLAGVVLIEPPTYSNSMLQVSLVAILLLALSALLLGILLEVWSVLIQFYSLRWLLDRFDVIPYPFQISALTSYLDAMSERIFLRRVGDGWIFIHRTLLDYFASLHPSNKGKTEYERSTF
ncbi:MAG: hypothetical protein CL608_20205 [Anaerolineaceae bacterium]|nr:hypothetical protein [Anaerolineaceae bacterium]